MPRGAGVRLAALVLGGLASACTTAPVGLPPVAVTATGETAPVGTADADAADDPAIWRNAADPAASLIVATDKRAGLYVYGLDGGVRSFVDAGAVNNVDLRELADGRVVVVASDRNDLTEAALQVYLLDTRAGTLAPLGRVPGGSGEGYGLCLGLTGGELRAYSVLKEGRVHEYLLGVDGVPTAAAGRVFSVPTQAEGCVVDDRDGTLYVAEENAGIWRFAPGHPAGDLVAAVDNRYLVADVEGLALAAEGQDAGYLIASSQGDNAYAVFRLPGMAAVGRFRVAAGTFGATEETDGIDLVTGNFGAEYPQGLFVAQDGQNRPNAQNFKLVSWSEVRAVLGIP
ncbi:MAG: phytase [Erythrobacter sp.]|nr:phytase [Erythrobacter sp.]